MWQVQWSRRAESEIAPLPRRDRERVLRALEQLAETERGDVIKLRGRVSEWRLRVGHWRVIFVWDHPNNCIRVLRVLHRREAYR